MGGLLGRNRAPTNDPFYNPVPPPGAGPAGAGPGAGLGAYGPYQEYEPTVALANYAGPAKRRADPYGGRYAQGLNQVPGIAPWNYGNYYLGNTTMQMMPMMLNKVHEYGQIQARAALGNAGLLGSGPGNAGFLGSASMMQSMPMMPCCIPPSFSAPMAAPMMAAATPLPVAFNPLVQGMYPLASMNPVNWMTPSSFMSALSSGPMPYRPPAFDFPNNVGMVMTVPYGTPNPLLAPPSFGGFNSSYNYGGGSSWCCCCCSMPPPATAFAPPPISYYPPPTNVPQSYPAPYSIPPPVPQPMSVPAPPMVAGGYQSLPVSSGAPLWPSQGTVTNGGFGQPAVMAFSHNAIKQIPTNNQPVHGSLPVYNATDQSQRLMGQQFTSNLFDTQSNNNQQQGITPSAAKNVNQFSQNRDTFSDRFRRYIPSIPRFSSSNYKFKRSEPPSDSALPPILHGQLISDSGWLPKNSIPQAITSILSSKSRKRPLYSNDIGKPMLNSSNSRVSFNPHRRRHRSNSSASEYDCAICQQQREKRRLREHYGSSTVSSLLSSTKDSRKHNFSSNESNFSSISRTSTSFKPNGYKSHRRHPTKIKIKSKSPSSNKSTSPVLLRQSPIQAQQQQQLHGTIHEEEEDGVDEPEPEPKLGLGLRSEQENVEKRSTDDNESVIERFDQYESKISLRSIDE